MSEKNLLRPDEATSTAHEIRELRSYVMEERRKLIEKEDAVKQAAGEAAIVQSRVSHYEELYREALERRYLGDDGEGRLVIVSGEVDAVVKKEGFWTFETRNVEELEVQTIEVQHPRFIPEIHDIREYEKSEATILAVDRANERLYVPESSIVESES